MVGSSWRKTNSATRAHTQPSLQTFLAPPDPILALNTYPAMVLEPLPPRGYQGLVSEASSLGRSGAPTPVATLTARSTVSLSGSSTRRYLCHGFPVEIGELIHSLSTKDTIRAMVVNLEEAHRREMLDVWDELGLLTTRVESSKVILAAVEARLGQIEKVLMDAEVQLTEMRLLLEDHKDKGRRNNLRIRDGGSLKFT